MIPRRGRGFKRLLTLSLIGLLFDGVVAADSYSAAGTCGSIAKVQKTSGDAYREIIEEVPDIQVERAAQTYFGKRGFALQEGDRIEALRAGYVVTLQWFPPRSFTAEYPVFRSPFSYNLACSRNALTEFWGTILALFREHELRIVGRKYEAGSLRTFFQLTVPQGEEGAVQLLVLQGRGYVKSGQVRVEVGPLKEAIAIPGQRPSLRSVAIAYATTNVAWTRNVSLPSTFRSTLAQALGRPLAAGKLEIFSWWTTGDEAKGLNALFEISRKRYPGLEIINAAVAGGPAANGPVAISARLAGGDAPDSFQVRGDSGLIESLVKAGYMEPISSLYKSEGWLEAFPRVLVNTLTFKGDQYSVPVDVHRANVLWYNKTILAENGLTAPKTWDEFFQLADVLKVKGGIPLALGDRDNWEAAHLFVSVLLATLGSHRYRSLWIGQTPWIGDDVKRALETFAKILTYVNADHAALSWDDAAQMLILRKSAMTVMGDWVVSYFSNMSWRANVDYGFVPAPGTAGSFIVVTDTFGLPKMAPHREQAIEWLKVVGSREGQEAFNSLKGSICARKDCDPRRLDVYFRSSASDYAKDQLVFGAVHGSSSDFVRAFNDIIDQFVTGRDVTATQKALQSACVENRMCRR